MKERTIFAICGIALMALSFSGCPTEEKPDTTTGNEPAGTITITNIPKTIGSKTTYKIYVNLSDSMSQSESHKAQGTKDITDADFVNDKASVTIDLYKAPVKNPGDPDPDPDSHGDAWSGIASFFQVTISPQNVSGMADILAKGGLGFNASQKQFDWNSNTLMEVDSAFTGTATTEANKRAIYNRIILNDKDTVGTGITIQGP